MQKNKIHWDFISKELSLTHKQIQKHQKKLNWDLISKNQFLKKDTILQFSKKLNLIEVFKRNKVEEDVIKKLAKKLSKEAWEEIIISQSLSETFIKNNFHYLDKKLLLKHQVLPMDIIDIIILNKEENCSLRELWRIVSEHQELSFDMLSKYSKQLDWKLVSMHQNLDMEALDMFFDNLDLDLVCKHQILPIPFIRRYVKHLNWELLLQYQRIDNYLLLENSQYIKNNNKLKILIGKFQKVNSEVIKEFKLKINNPILAVVYGGYNNLPFVIYEKDPSSVLIPGKKTCSQTDANKFLKWAANNENPVNIELIDKVALCFETAELNSLSQ